jgi:hypothetical protein
MRAILSMLLGASVLLLTLDAVELDGGVRVVNIYYCGDANEKCVF